MPQNIGITDALRTTETELSAEVMTRKVTCYQWNHCVGHIPMRDTNQDQSLITILVVLTFQTYIYSTPSRIQKQPIDDILPYS